jgi:hypothetical protein
MVKGKVHLRMSKNTIGVGVLLALIATLSTPTAEAGSITLNITGADTGSITLTETGNDTPITNIAGTWDGSTIAGLTTGLGNDNLFFTAPPYFDTEGLAFTLATPDINNDLIIILYSSLSGSLDTFACNVIDGNECTSQYTGTDPISPGTPEPAAWLMISLGMGTLLIYGWWKKQIELRTQRP